MSSAGILTSGMILQAGHDDNGSYVIGWRLIGGILSFDVAGGEGLRLRLWLPAEQPV